jgi:hypothetical protein
MLVRMVWWRKKLSAEEKAAEIIAKHHAKRIATVESSPNCRKRSVRI